jgi:hypothetical protein
MQKIPTVLISTLLSLLLGLSFSKAQKEGFNKVYHHPTAAGNVGTTPLELDSSYLILGRADTNELTKEGKMLMLYELDRGGDTVRTNRFLEGWPGSYGAGGFENLISAPDSGYYAVGGYRDSSSNFRSMLFRIGEDLDTLWTRSYGASDTLKDRFLGIELLPSGNLIITGQKGNPGYYGANAWILKTDPKGNIIWSHQYGNDKDQEFSLVSLQQTPDGGFIAGGGISRSLTGQGDKFGSGLLVRLDSTGQKEWQRSFMGDYGYWVSSVHLSNDSTYIAGGGKPLDVVENIGSPDEQVGMIRKYRNDGTLVWEKLHNPDTSEPHDATDGFVNYMTPGSDGSWIFAGFRRLSPVSNTDSIESGWIFKTDSNGNLLWMRGFRYHDIGEHSFWNVREVEKKRILAVGDASHPDTTYGRPSLWVLKLDSNGCVSSGCSVGIQEHQERITSGFRVFPNPNDGSFKVRSERKKGSYQGTLRIFDQKGRTLLRRTMKGRYPFKEKMSLSESTPGVYFIEWKDKDGRYLKKVVIR